MVKSLIALAMIPRLMNPSQADMEDYVNNYINNTCQYLKYSYDQTQQKYILQDKVTTYNNQDAHTTFKFTLFMDYTITERITHMWPLGDAFTIYLSNGNDTSERPNIIGTCTEILTLNSIENKKKK